MLRSDWWRCLHAAGQRRLRTALGRGALSLLLLWCGCSVSPPQKSFKISTQPIRVDYRRVNTLMIPGPLPVVVFESGLGDTMRSWSAVQPRLAGRAYTFAYDRGGLGGSDPIPPPRDGRQIALELHTALTNAHLPPPYVLVGHSAGAFYIRIFAGLYPGEVAGFVFVEPATEYFFNALQTQFPGDYRVFAEQRDNPRMPPYVRHEAQAWDATVDEARASILPKVPMTVITAGQSWPDQWELWWQGHEMLVQESPRPRHKIAKLSGHYVQLSQPELVADAIMEVLADSRAMGKAGPKAGP